MIYPEIVLEGPGIVTVRMVNKNSQGECG